VPATESTLPSTNDVRAILETMGAPATYPKNAVLFQQGDAPIGVYVVRRGAVRMTVNAGGSQVLMRIAHPGSVIGLPGVLGNKPYSLTAITMQASELMFVPAEKLIETIRGNPILGLQVLQLLSEDVRSARGAIASTRQSVKM
jgi:CRP-like cAMP-binding protein